MKDPVHNNIDEIIDFEDSDIVPSAIESSLSSFDDKDNAKLQDKNTSSFNYESIKMSDKSVIILNDYSQIEDKRYISPI